MSNYNTNQPRPLMDYDERMMQMKFQTQIYSTHKKTSHTL